MAIPVFRLLLIPSLAIVCSAQVATPTKAETLAQAKRLAASFPFETLHNDVAKGFAKLGPVALPILAGALRTGTDGLHAAHKEAHKEECGSAASARFGSSLGSEHLADR